MFLDYDTVVSYSSARDHSSDVKQGQNLEAETEAKARAMRSKPRPRPKIIIKKYQIMINNM